MFKQQVVKDCPVTRGSRGMVRIEPEVLAELAGTLEDEKGWEWAVLLHGRRDADGWDVLVEAISVPPQERDGTEVDIDEKVELAGDVVGVLHSHHGMGAFFSGTDRTQLNPRFPMSIVISSNLVDDESVWLGFSYLAEGRVKLPCGAMGVVEFGMVPAGVEDWPVAHQVYRGAEKPADLGDCCERVTGEANGKYVVSEYGACEMTDEVARARRAVLGLGTHGLTQVLPGSRRWRPTAAHAGYVRALEPARVNDKRRLLHEARDEAAGAYVGTVIQLCEYCGAQDGELTVLDGGWVCKECRMEMLEREAAEWLDERGWRQRDDEPWWKGGGR